MEVAIGGDAIAHAIRRIYDKTVNVKRDLDPELYEETVRVFNRAAAVGISEAEEAGTPIPEDRFLTAIKTNNEVFSAFRVHRMQKDIAAMMTDSDGNLKSFSRFARDVQPYTDHQNRQWLRTEYSTAVIRAHHAADWQQFEEEKDVLPNLEWMPSTSAHPGTDHRAFWGTVRPVNDPFWNEHRPGDRWNCKCRLRSTDAKPTAAPRGSDADMPNLGLDNNPGKDGKLFSDRHPYMPDSCGSCPFGHGKLWALATGRKKSCGTCRGLEKATGKAGEKSVAAIERNKRLEEMKPLLNVKDTKQTDEKPITVGFNKYGNKHLLSDTFGRSKILQKEDLKDLDRVLAKANFVKKSELSKVRKDGIKRFYYYEAQLHGKTVYLNVAETDIVSSKGNIWHDRFLYSVTDRIK